MTREELVKIIEEAVESKVRKAIREEFRDILVEAVEIASRPDIKPEKRIKRTMDTQPGVSSNPIDSLLQETYASMTGEDYRRVFSEPSAEGNQGVDPELPDFALRAASIYEASKKVKNRHNNAL